MSWEDNREGVPALGTVHPFDACCLCGDRKGTHVVGVNKDTRARGLFCENVAACERRRYKRKQLRLFGPESDRRGATSAAALRRSFRRARGKPAA